MGMKGDLENSGTPKSAREREREREKRGTDGKDGKKERKKVSGGAKESEDKEERWAGEETKKETIELLPTLSGSHI